MILFLTSNYDSIRLKLIFISDLVLLFFVGASQAIMIIFQKFGVEFIYNVLLVSCVQQSESVIYIYILTFFRFFSHISHYRVLSRVPWLVICFIYYSNVYMSVPISQFIHTPVLVFLINNKIIKYLAARKINSFTQM